MLAAGATAARQARNPRSNTVLGLAFGIAAVALPCFAYLGDGIPPRASGLALLATLTLLVYSAARLSSLIMGARLLPIAGVVWLFLYVSLAVVPLAQMHTGLYPALHSKAYLPAAQIMALLAAVSFDVGRFVSERRHPEEEADAQPPSELSVARLRILTVVAVLASGYYISTTGLAALFSSRQELGDSLVAAGLRSGGSQVGSAFVVMFGTVPALVCLIGWTLYRFRVRRGQSFTVGVLGWLGLVAINVAVNNPISNARYWFLTVAVAITFSLPWFSPRLFRATLVLGVVAALLLFPYSDRFRTAENTQLIDTRYTDSIAETISTKDYDQSIMTANGIWYVEHAGHTFGRQLLGDALFAVPRAVWPDKPQDTGVLIGEAIRSFNTNLSSPLFLEFYVDFGWVGVVVGMAAVGWASGRGDRLFARRVDRFRDRIYVTDLLLPLLAGYSFILLRGPLLQSMSRLAVMVACCSLLAVAVSEKPSRPALVS
jgi:hypothetical protein